MSISNKGAHILVFPYPAQGHMLPMLDLTHHLAHHHGLTITIIITPKNLPLLTPLLSSSPFIQTLILPFPPHPSLPSHVENIKHIGNHANLAIINSLAKLKAPIIQWIASHPNPPVAIISDFFLGWTHQLGIPRIVFFSSGAFLASLLHYICRNLDFVRSQDVINIPDLINSPSFPKEHLPTIVRRYRESDPEWELVMNGLIVNTLSYGCVVNTFDALESHYLEHLRKIMGHNRVFGVGPLSLLSGSDLNTGSGTDVMKWLDGKPDGSVLYVCFGSQKFLTRDQTEALAKGLEHSGVHFVWVVNEDPTREGNGWVPEGFEERVWGRGMVIKGWAPQVLILSHRVVGGFLSHCGWNSVLEGIVGGVMILGWPMEADQYVDAKLVVEEHGMGVQVCEGGDTVPDSAALAQRIAESMNGCKTQKVRAKVMKEKAIDAVKEGGSSSKDLDRLVRELCILVPKNE